MCTLWDPIFSEADLKKYEIKEDSRFNITYKLCRNTVCVHDVFHTSIADFQV